jgi:ABC-type enterochelin transport system permease subunit
MVLLEEVTSSMHLLLLVGVAVVDCSLTGLVEELMLPQNFEYNKQIDLF